MTIFLSDALAGLDRHRRRCARRLAMNDKRLMDRLTCGEPLLFTAITDPFPRVQFDGHWWRGLDPQALPVLHLAAQARRGDALATELLTVWGGTIVDEDGKQYWPATPSGAASPG